MADNIYNAPGGSGATAGTLAARPAATGSHAIYTATDDSGGTTYQDTAPGVWTPMASAVFPRRPGPAYNVDATVFPVWRQNVGKVRAGTGDCRVICMGDSTTQGGPAGGLFANAYPTRLTALLNSYYAPATNGGFYGNEPFWNISDPRVSWGANWSGNSGFSWSGGMKGLVAGGNLSITPTQQFDTITIFYLKGPAVGGSSTVNVDGGATLTTLNGTNGTLITAQTTVSCALGTHTINISTPTGAQIFIIGVEVSNSTARSIIIGNAGLSGTTTTAQKTNTAGTGVKQSFDEVKPHLTIINLGINDAAASATPATVTANMTAIIGYAKAWGDVLIVNPNPNGTGATQTRLASYTAGVKALAGSLGCGFLDIQERWVSYAVSNPLGYYSDVTHPNAAGYIDIAQAVFSVLSSI